MFSPRQTAKYLCFALASLCLAGPGVAAMYLFVDENGVPHYSNVAGDPRAIALWRDPEGPKSIELPTAPVTTLLKPAPAELVPVIHDTARHHGLEPALLMAVISVESRYNPKAVSPKGAKGLMQLMPATARRFGVEDAFDIRQNLHGGARYLRDLMQRFDNNLELVLAAYNAGEQSVIRNGNRVPPYKETQNYVPAVLGQFALLRASPSVN